jgi:hypothetical protein
MSLTSDQAPSRKEHLLNLARAAECEAKRLGAGKSKDRRDARRYWKLADVYRDMAQAEKEVADV